MCVRSDTTGAVHHGSEVCSKEPLGLGRWKQDACQKGPPLWGLPACAHLGNALLPAHQWHRVCYSHRTRPTWTCFAVVYSLIPPRRL